MLNKGLLVGQILAPDAARKMRRGGPKLVEQYVHGERIEDQR
jgi:hypothetical protein